MSGSLCPMQSRAVASLFWMVTVLRHIAKDLIHSQFVRARGGAHLVLRSVYVCQEDAFDC